MKKPITKFLSMTLVIAMMAGIFTGCEQQSKKKSRSDVKETENQLFEEVEQREVDVDVDLESDARYSLTDFGLEILKNNNNSENKMISPLSILTALTMVANGSDGITKEEFEEVFGMTIEDANAYLYLLSETVTNTEVNEVRTANAIWVNSDKEIEMDKDFLQAMSDYFSSNVYYQKFNDKCLKDINNFVDENTDGMIEKIIDNLSGKEPMILINTLTFDAEWEDEYESDSVNDSIFYNLDGTTSDIKMMSSTEYAFLKCNQGTGFIKDYKNGDFAFVALLPDEDVSIDEFVSNLTAEEFINTVSNPEYVSVDCGLPEFKSEYSITLNETLMKMGLKTAFSEDADFSKLSEGDNDVYIDCVIHKTYIEVTEKGTKASAATALEMKDCALESSDEMVYLDRPFVYAIVDSKTSTPLFIGVVNNL